MLSHRSFYREKNIIFEKKPLESKLKKYFSSGNRVLWLQQMKSKEYVLELLFFNRLLLKDSACNSNRLGKINF